MELVEMARKETDLEKAWSMGSLGNQEPERTVADNSLDSLNSPLSNRDTRS